MPDASGHGAEDLNVAQSVPGRATRRIRGQSGGAGATAPLEQLMGF